MTPDDSTNVEILPAFNADDEPAMFDTLEEFFAAAGWDLATQERCRRDMELTRPRETSDTVH